MFPREGHILVADGNHDRHSIRSNIDRIGLDPPAPETHGRRGRARRGAGDPVGGRPDVAAGAPPAEESPPPAPSARAAEPARTAPPPPPRVAWPPADWYGSGSAAPGELQAGERMPFRPFGFTAAVGAGGLFGPGEDTLGIAYNLFRLGLGLAPGGSFVFGYEGTGASSDNPATQSNSWLQQHV